MKPRQGQAESSSATRELTKRFRAADELLNERLDALAVQFKDSQPAFFHAYQSARVIVDHPGSHASKAGPTAGGAGQPLRKAA